MRAAIPALPRSARCRAYRLPTRLRVEPGTSCFSDRIQGTTPRRGVRRGDIILKRRDHVFAYLLAVVVDDAEQGVTHVVRGADLLETRRGQIYLQQLLGLPQPAYAQRPRTDRTRRHQTAKSRAACVWIKERFCRSFCGLSMLGCESPQRFAGNRCRRLEWAIAHFTIGQVPRRLNLRVTD